VEKCLLGAPLVMLGAISFADLIKQARGLVPSMVLFAAGIVAV
jgi:hypothetical protein